MSRFMPSASSLHVFQECTGFSTIPETYEMSDAAQYGVDRHADLERIMDGHGPVPEWAKPILQILTENGIPISGAETEVTFVFDPFGGAINTRMLGTKMGRKYPRLDFSEHAVFGTADYIANGWLIDWKFTNAAHDSIYAQLPPIDSHQLKFLASCWLMETKAEECKIALVKIPDGMRPWIEFDKWDIMSAHRYLTDLANRALGQQSFFPGPHCSVCNKFRVCPTRTAILRSAIGEGALEINRDNAPAIVQRLVDVRKALDIAEDQLQEYVKITGDDIQLGNGYFYGKSKGSRRDIADPVKAVAMLSEVLGPDASSALLHTNPKMYIGELDKAATAAGKNPKEVTAWLERSGIIKRNDYESIGLHRARGKKG